MLSPDGKLTSGGRRTFLPSGDGAFSAFAGHSLVFVVEFSDPVEACAIVSYEQRQRPESSAQRRSVVAVLGTIRQIKLVPVEYRALVPVVAAALIPMLPVAAFEMPVAEPVKRLVGALL